MGLLEWFLTLVLLCRQSSGRILEALHVDPASGVSLDKEKNAKAVKPAVRYGIMSRDTDDVRTHYCLVEFEPTSLCVMILFFFFNSTSSALAKLTKASSSGGPLKQQPGEKKETPQERLKRIMSKQLNKQSMILK